MKFLYDNAPAKQSQLKAEDESEIRNHVLKLKYLLGEYKAEYEEELIEPMIKLLKEAC